MGRHSRSRKQNQKKQEKAQPTASAREVDDDDTGGSLMSMRAGFKNITGTGDGAAAQKGGLGSILGWVAFAVLLAALVFFFVGR